MSYGGVNLVIAGAGTGKTKTLVEKVRNIIKSGISPENILILTFSRKAAEEIRERVKSQTGENAGKITAGTFHSFCLSFLRSNRDLFIKKYGFNEFPLILDQDERDSLILEMLKERMDCFLGLPVTIVRGLLEADLDKKTYMKLKRLGIIDELEGFKKRFKEYKRSYNLIDFGDMMDFAIDFLANNTDVREKTVNRYQYILIDEFQDTSEDNFKLLKLLVPDKPNLFLVGDDWQSIYAFRGARVEYIIKMKKYFPKVIVHKLTVNYRSKKEIVELSNKFIKHNKNRTSKKLSSFKGRGGHVEGHQVNDHKEEIDLIKDIIAAEETYSRDIAVIFRNNWQGKYILKELKDIRLLKSGDIKLMTIHSSKGLEFDNVIIAGVSDGIIPDPSTDIEEERRLLYVALTRAKERLHIIHHRPSDEELSLFARELGLSNE